MTTARTPAALVRDTEHALTAARVADAFLAQHPDLPVEYYRAGHIEDAPTLLVQLGQNMPALVAFAARVKGDVLDFSEVVRRVETSVGGVAVWVTAWGFDDEPAGAGS